MIEAEKVLMKRALDLARKGEGLVSPNPMVGALLVHEGRVLGHGYHRYDRLKHAESYAIEMAGRESLGATLYCTLEPCCNTGRTPPCTEALIEAGIARAVIATRDPNPNVNGQGLEQLRQAGIEVEVGLCEDEALRLIEAYAKFITTGLPFVHGVIEYTEPDCVRGDCDWRPSRDFLRMSGACDAVLSGGNASAAGAIIECHLNRERHRSPVIIASRAQIDGLTLDARNREARLISLDEVVTGPASAAHHTPLRVVGAMPRRSTEELSGVDLEALLGTIANIGVTSVVVLPGSVDFNIRANFEMLDKLTLVAPGGADFTRSTTFALDEVEFELEDVSLTDADDYTELTGYPTMLEVA